jgi:hypothetical protein
MTFLQRGIICLSQTGFFLLAPKETKVPAENFCFKVSAKA